MFIVGKRYEAEANNDWAQDKAKNHLYIDDAISGRKGYYCIGCDKEMEAVIKKKNPNHRSYFRHVPVVKSNGEAPCTFSNQEYRETLAKDILQRIKEIKVPSVIKYPLNESDGPPKLLKRAEYINATKVSSNVIFYEDVDGSIKYGNYQKLDCNEPLLKPDVTFFNEIGFPVLLIEFVTKHKLDKEKNIILRKLQFDTVSIIIPKVSPQGIEDNFSSTKRIKWQYNGLEAKTTYRHIPSGSYRGVSEVDELQRRIYRESYNCRKARINNVIRRIGKCVQSEQFGKSEEYLNSEVTGLEELIKIERKGLESMEGRFREEVFGKFAEQEKEIESGERKLQQTKTDLEGRYFAKKREIDDASESHKPEGINISRNQRAEIKKFEEGLRRNKHDILELNFEIERLEREIESFEK
ncbi:hypothetical protein [Algibacter mikhailovii]|uniref:Uncharacterized protein n=1 Tax=Algibacter mikhailovii TaxID=425498 RepID=A0A918R6X0_9FLAO|nr:hypothetical protein [Algibacter mikhailovii]GGZ88246.1 hypothetical protein GCM10007028_28210 [Algibacter mikhailovii]